MIEHMFEEQLAVFAARLLVDAPAQDDPFDPVLDRDATLVDRLVRNARGDRRPAGRHDRDPIRPV